MPKGGRRFSGATLLSVPRSPREAGTCRSRTSLSREDFFGALTEQTLELVFAVALSNVLHPVENLVDIVWAMRVTARSMIEARFEQFSGAFLGLFAVLADEGSRVE
jgi:hypothetical protein